MSSSCYSRAIQLLMGMNQGPKMSLGDLANLCANELDHRGIDADVSSEGFDWSSGSTAPVATADWTR